MDMDKGQQRVADTIASQLQPGEQIQAILKTSQTGPSPVVFAFVGAIWSLFQQFYAIAVTDRQVFFVSLSKLSGRASKVAQVYPRSGVKVIEFKEGALWSALRLDRPGAGEIKLNVARIVRSSAEAVVAALNVPPAP